MPVTYHPNPDYDFPRDLKGYGEQSLDPKWPNNAKIAISFVINYEEGAELSVANGDSTSEPALREFAIGPPWSGERNYTTESEYEYGSRAGFWRLFRLFDRFGMKYTLFAIAQACEEVPEVVKRSVEVGHEVAAHGYRWIDYYHLSADREKEYIRRAVLSLKSLSGYIPRGWYYGRDSPRSRALVPQVYRELNEQLLWYSDTYADDLPYWINLPAERDTPEEEKKGLLMLPYSFDCNDFKFFAPGAGFVDPNAFASHLRNAFDVLYEEGVDGSPKMMTVGVHCRIMGRPGRLAALRSFLEYISSKDGVWVATRTEIAEAFTANHHHKRSQLA